MTAQAWVTLGVGIFAAVGVIAGILQKTYFDRRAEWWRRATWAVDHTLSDDVNAQVVAFEVLAKLQVEWLTTRRDRELFAEWGAERLLGLDDTGDDNELVSVDTEGRREDDQ